MKKKDFLLPVLSTLLLSPFILTQQVQAAETATTPQANQATTPASSASTAEATTPLAEEAVEGVIIHTNDVHGRILEERGVIGDAKAAAVIEEERSKVKNTIVVDAGDAFQGLPISNSTKGEDRAKIMNQVGYDAMVVGNHEFDFGMDQAIKYKETLNFPLLSANTYVNGARVFEASTIIDKTPTVAGDEFVVIGVTTPETATKTHPKNVEGVTFTDPITEVNKVIDEVEARALADNRVYKNYIILAHLGVDSTTPVEWRGSTLAQALSENSKLAGKRVIVIDGHSHTVEATTYGKNVTYNQTGSYLNNIGKVTLRSQQLLGEASLISADDAKNITPNQAIAKLVEEIKAKYEADNAQIVIEKNNVELNGDRSNVRVRETNLGSAIADAIYAYGQTGFSNKTSLAVTNGGGIRATIAKDLPVTKGDIIAVLPFGNIISQITVTGQQIADMFTKSLSSTLQVDKETGKMILDENGMPLFEASGGFLHISGAQVFYDPTLPAKDRVLIIGILNPETGKYEELDLQKTYYLATNDFLAAGGDGYTMLGGAREEGPSMDSVFAEYLKTADLSAYKVVNPYSRLLPVNSSLDTDGDGYPDFMEMLLDTDPENPTSNPDVTPEDKSDTVPHQVETVSILEKNDQSKVSKKSDTVRTAKTSKATTLPNTSSQSNVVLSLFGFGLAGLAVTVRRRESK
ncbi:cell surface ecto-5'-nucleotidase Nt5e [Streptococcus ruminantium]|uniref:Cell surface ecto-5'-nucleotidase Nt5e n=1 Tax=Streptococcus ruminantium TaxID=1917441 RepID=A0ABU1B4Z5_9STRE|nr:cell surface ecto-5'-nucleotidase Nt5e [Streptococcus ruminantium]MDQ8758846.1 cell surface ecto-5'-nucleotidase Nt5e [Streptococcus ruminantium]MDQ8764810.1 cell surface ecto-5'-nucleotidase Nt5e [Streptococcus ruminantium]MDQ8768237.1 cell surface ecto-5'-nucleotidase Nt5e [Streptococcus ruminantium]MDQ8774684.1 cell surface ecto-5'-nucleotidase Nt5e [Streptococcus ruminantium]MDQ8793604.1 cell surface ecto-5'-nucleotidase Nt5e [Streptococcus ruminantium]